LLITVTLRAVFATIRQFQELDVEVPYVNTINTWAEVKSAEGVTANTVIDSNDSPPGASA
jgi:hypothetical protein